MPTQTDVFHFLVKDCMITHPLIVDENDSCFDVINQINSKKTTCALITNSANNLIGIVTEQDVIRKVVFKADKDLPISKIMNSPVTTIYRDDHLFRAIVKMRRGNLRHIPVITDQAEIVGMMALHSALQFISSDIMEHIEAITTEDNLGGLERVKKAQVKLAHDLLKEAVPSAEILQLITSINSDIHRRVVKLCIREMVNDGWGEPPIAFSLLILGSGGRGENFLHPDQDNGFILGDYDDSDHLAIDSYFIELGDRMTKALDEIGFELCKGNVMATNPIWRKSISQWKEQVSFWMRRRNNVTLRLSDIFFDFKHCYGKKSLSDELKDYVTKTLKINHGFIKDMYELEADHKVALGWFNNLVTEQDDKYKGMINLKYSGSLPLVEGVRLLSLKNGVSSSNTIDRINKLSELGVIDTDMQDYLVNSFLHITKLLLRQQLRDFQKGKKVGNYVTLKKLKKREKDYLIQCFKAVDEFRGGLKMEFSHETF